jgi:hypothetical protein
VVVWRGDWCRRLYAAKEVVGESTSSSTLEASQPPRPSADMAAFLLRPVRRPCFDPAAGARSFQAAKWFVPCSLEVDRGGSSTPEGDPRASGSCSSVATPGGRRRSVAEAPRSLITLIKIVVGCFSVKCEPLSSNSRFFEQGLQGVCCKFVYLPH